MRAADRTLPGRAAPAFDVPRKHFVNGNRIQPPFPAGLEQIMLGMGCFRGAEPMFWQAPGVYATAVGSSTSPGIPAAIAAGRHRRDLPDRARRPGGGVVFAGSAPLRGALLMLFWTASLRLAHERHGVARSQQ